jgi:ABC-type branched-subunit amino acid transport system ATPase component
MSAEPVLATRGLCKSFGALQAAADIAFSLAPGARHALIGPNGAGKTTFVHLLTGVLTPTRGEIFLRGADISRLAPERRVQQGLVRTFQVNALFPALTPLEATLLAVCRHRGISGNFLRSVFAHDEAVHEATTLLDRLGLTAECNRPTAELAYGRQRLLEIALALACHPKVLLLDEPAAGVPQRDSAELFATIAALPRDVAILFIEHDMELVFRFAETITVMVGGRILCGGVPAEVARDARVRAAYLGDEFELE